jgi:hypothetical protein
MLYEFDESLSNITAEIGNCAHFILQISKLRNAWILSNAFLTISFDERKRNRNYGIERIIALWRILQWQKIESKKKCCALGVAKKFN